MRRSYFFIILAIIFILIYAQGAESLKIKGINCSINMVNNTYLKGVKSITFFSKSNINIGGYYFIGQANIYIFNGCDITILRHELAHHCQANRGDTYAIMMKHAGNFSACLRAIKNNN